jgi:Ca2+-binding EF-hand superfamily protein
MDEGEPNKNKFGIPSDELAELTEIFNLVDIDHGGSIDGAELKQLMQTLGIQTTEVFVFHIARIRPLGNFHQY